MRNENEWIGEYRSVEAFWVHDGNPKRPHALLTSGNHSGGFVNCGLITANEPLLVETAWSLVLVLRAADLDLSQVDRVVGPQTGATKLAKFLSFGIGRDRRRSCKWASPAKYERDGVRGMIFEPGRQKALSGERVLLCEDVLTTGKSITLAEEAVWREGATVLPFLAAVVNRSGLKEHREKKIVALIDRALPMWKASECPLCSQGSIAIRPKGKQEWARLTAEY